MPHRDFDPKRRHALQSLGLGLGMLAAGTALAQTSASPPGTVRLLVGYPPGGGADVLARALSPHLSQTLDRTCVVDNRPGAGGTLAAGLLAHAPADGSVVYLTESAILAAPAIYDKIGYDPLTLTPITSMGRLPYTVVVNPDFPARNVAELIAVLKANPGKYSYASPGVGNIAHLAAEMFKRDAGVDMIHVPYRGGTPALTDLVGGQIPICFVSLPPVLPLARTNRLRLLGLTTAERSDATKDTPTISETLAGFDIAANFFAMAPPKTPAAVVERLNKAFRSALALPQVRKEYGAQGASVRTSTPEELAAQIRAEVDRLGSVARGAKIRATAS